MVEKEYKIILNSKEYEKIKKTYIWDEKYIQENYYYDTKNLDLYKLGITFRIRKKNLKYTVQIKLNNKTNECIYKTKEEYEHDINYIPLCVNSEQYNEINEYVHGKLYLIEKLVTKRRMKQLSECSAIFLDKSFYLERHDYELEFEFDNNDEECLNEIQKLGLSFKLKVSPDGKYKRFIKEYISKYKKGGK
ncbi:CYTH domain-containing protein [Hathewaya proteolytica]|nr:CYTH domain-containing protein [Hathewaya proteolytica]